MSSLLKTWGDIRCLREFLEAHVDRYEGEELERAAAQGKRLREIAEAELKALQKKLKAEEKPAEAIKD